MPRRPIIPTLPGWEEADNPDGPFTLSRPDHENGVIQVSAQLYTRGQRPGAGPDDVRDLARSAAERDGFEVIDTISGRCPFGSYAVARCRSAQFARAQFWYLTNGDDFIFATYLAAAADEAELRQAETIIFNLGLSKPRPWWKFW